MNKPNTIPTAGPDFEHLLAQEVVIEAGEAAQRTGAQADRTRPFAARAAGRCGQRPRAR